MLQGDFGYSFEYELPVSEVVGERLWLTVLVSFVTIIFTWVIAFPIGLYAATHQYSWGDYGLSLIGLIGIAIPISCWPSSSCISPISGSEPRSAI